VKSIYHEIREGIDEHFPPLYQHAVHLAKEVDEPMVISGPRSAGMQRHRANVPAANPEESYRRNCAVPFLDHIITELDAQFSGNH